MKKKKKTTVMTTKEFAQKAKVTVQTVQGYCRRIFNGDRETLKQLHKLYGLKSVERYSDKWAMTVEV